MNINAYYELKILIGNDYNFLNVEIIKHKLEDLKAFNNFIHHVRHYGYQNGRSDKYPLNVSFHPKKKDVFKFITEVIPNEYQIQLYYDRGQNPDEEKRFFEVEYKEKLFLDCRFSNYAVYQFSKKFIDEDFTYTDKDGTEETMTFKRILFPNPKKVPYYQINYEPS